MKILKFLCIFILIFAFFCPLKAQSVFADIIKSQPDYAQNAAESEKKKFVKWVDLKVPSEILKKCFETEIKFKNAGKNNFDTIKVLSYLTCQNGNKWNTRASMASLNKLIKQLDDNLKIDELGSKSKFYSHYIEVYDAVFKEYVGKNSKNIYKLKVFHPFAKNHWLKHGDDFGNERTYGFKRKHLGHDMFGSVGTPIMAIEGGTIAELGWNQYGGWRMGIRSNDTKRYYYYAHLRKNKPYADGLKIGDKVEAGAHIGYLGVTGYSKNENVNMTTTNSHLHLGLQLIFDKSQENGNGEIWVDVFQIVKLLEKNKAVFSKPELKTTQQT